MIAFAEIPVVTGGLPSCRQCEAAPSRGVVPAADIIVQLERIAAGWTSGPGPNVTFSGGESLNHPELPALIGEARRLGFERIRLRTSGGPLAAHENAAGAQHAGVRQLDVVRLAGDAQSEDALSGAAGGFRNGMAGVAAWFAAAREAGHTVCVTASVPVCRHNLPLTPTTVAALAKVGVTSITLDVSGTAAASVKAAEWLRAATDSGVVNGAWVTVRGARPGAVAALHEHPVMTGVDLL